ncbi:hypothetical protein [Rhodococcus sp. NPDC058521]|uniref:hypothetical protein n=1 Tax=Rhodococcus sp. NPDC058521 TaxID=3346536 RepID=UPI003669F103
MIFAVVAIVVGVVVVLGSDHRSQSDAARHELQYDGKDPRGLDGADSRCADPPPSLEVKASRPPVLGPDGTVVGVVEVRTSASCPGVVWARVPWNNDRGEADPSAVYQIPAGWVLHVVTHRPGTATSVDTPEPSVAGPIPYGLSTMLTTARGCVYVEAYFSNGDDRTVSALTPCVTP